MGTLLTKTNKFVSNGTGETTVRVTPRIRNLALLRRYGLRLSALDLAILGLLLRPLR